MTLRINRKTETSEVTIKGKAENIIEHMRDNNIRQCITKRDSFIFRKFSKKLFSRKSDRIVAVNYMQKRFDRFKKFNGSVEICTIPEKGNSLAYYVPCGIKGYAGITAIFEYLAGFLVIGVMGA